jgi:TrkA domain protein
MAPAAAEEASGMAQVEQTPLPGIGVRLDFTTIEGRRLGVVRHPDGRREVYIGSIEDPLAAAPCFSLADDEVHTMVEVLGGSRVTANLARLQEFVEGLAIEWLQVGANSPVAGASIASAGIRARSGVSVVAVLRAEQTHPAPGPEFRIAAGDTLVVIGTPEGITAAATILRAG